METVGKRCASEASTRLSCERGNEWPCVQAKKEDPAAIRQAFELIVRLPDRIESGNASTLNIVRGICKLQLIISATLPKDLKMVPLADQSIFARAAISGAVREALIAACLSGIMILLIRALGGGWNASSLSRRIQM